MGTEVRRLPWSSLMENVNSVAVRALLASHSLSNSTSIPPSLNLSHLSAFPNRSQPSLRWNGDRDDSFFCSLERIRILGVGAAGSSPTLRSVAWGVAEAGGCRGWGAAGAGGSRGWGAAEAGGSRGRGAAEAGGSGGGGAAEAEGSRGRGAAEAEVRFCRSVSMLAII